MILLAFFRLGGEMARGIEIISDSTLACVGSTNPANLNLIDTKQMPKGKRLFVDAEGIQLIVDALEFAYVSLLSH